MLLRDTGSHLEFISGETLAGKYAYRDDFKPFLHPLSTPSGTTVSLLSPHDHKHHKGLMYALRSSDVNFWEEVETVSGEAVGVQEHVSFTSLTEEGGEIGFVERLSWISKADGEPRFQERREVVCRFDPQGPAFEWTWKTHLSVVRDLRLIKSQWSPELPDGTRVNYHGLGLRFRRDFGCTGGNALLVDGEAATFEQAMGSKPSKVTFVGSVDGTWPVEKAAVSISQEQAGGLFVMESPFAFVSLGPTNLRSVTLKEGDELIETYHIRVYDVNA